MSYKDYIDKFAGFSDEALIQEFIAVEGIIGEDSLYLTIEDNLEILYHFIAINMVLALRYMKAWEGQNKLVTTKRISGKTILSKGSKLETNNGVLVSMTFDRQIFINNTFFGKFDDVNRVVVDDNDIDIFYLNGDGLFFVDVLTCRKWD